MKRIALLLCLSACEAHPTPPPGSPAPGAANTGADRAAAASPAAAPVPDAALLAALDGPARTAKEKARDPARHPAQTLAFFGLRPDCHVVELWPGGGWYTAILAPYLRASGELVITHFDPAADPESEDAAEARAILTRLDATPGVFDKVVRRRIAAPAFSLGPDGSADVVLTFRNVHNWIQARYEVQVFRAIARVLKLGGVLGVEEHRGAPGLSDDATDRTGYVSEARIIELAAAAGLVLEARSEINANPRDTKDHPHGVWSLPPTYQGKDVDRDKYTQIGESDRMTLRFRKR
jgi:predicted methyltransferase